MDIDLSAEPGVFADEPDTGMGVDLLQASDTDEYPTANDLEAGAQTTPPDTTQDDVREEIDRIEAVYQAALQDMIETALPRAREQIVDAVLDQLAPFLTRHVRDSMADRMISAMMAEISEALESQDAVSFELTGPESLLQRFREQWPDENRPAKLAVSDDIDLVARIGKSVLMTRLAEIDRTLQEFAS
jgi:uncharacterized protein with gpF-like domain